MPQDPSGSAETEIGGVETPVPKDEDEPVAEPGPSPDAGAKPKARLPEGVIVSARRDGRGTIQGRWLLPDGNPAAHRRVRAFRLGERETSRGQAVVATDVEGAYALHLDPAAWTVRFDDSEYAVPVAAGEVRTLDHAAVAGGALRVRVAGEGIQLHNALVTAVRKDDRQVQRARSRTDASGAALLEGLAPGPVTVTGVIYRSKPGTPVHVEAQTEVPPSGEKELVLLPPAGSLEVRVAGAGGGPLEGALIELWVDGRADPAHRTATDDRGRARLDLLPDGSARLAVSRPGHAPTARALTLEGAGSLHVRLDAGRSFPVRVTVDGEPRQGVLHAATRGGLLPHRFDIRLDQDGRGSLDNVPEEDVVLTIHSTGCASLEKELPASLRNGTSLDLRFSRTNP
jgi:hypothetical protein